MMILSKLINDVNAQIEGDTSKEVNSFQIDSRKISQGDLYAAIKGVALDGHDFIDAAINNGATVILCERLPLQTRTQVTYVKVSNALNALAKIANAFYNYPQSDMKIIGVTGTNGKTTIATLGWELMKRCNIKVGLFSTVNVMVDEKEYPATHTTPDIVQLYMRLAEMKEQGCSYVFMEVSSHALAQNRTAGIEFDAAIFSNISRDHLDYHGDLKSYINAKKILFDGLKKDAIAIICNDDKHAAYMVQNCKAKVRTYALNSVADVKGKILENDLNGLTVNINGREIVLQLSGKFNALNALSIYALAQEFEFEEDQILIALSQLIGAEGRFDKYLSPTGKLGIIDYAHSPDALEKLLINVKEILRPGQRIITVTGCGGDRDKGKRPMMAKIAAEQSSILILTSDNPRTEDPTQILEDMIAGIEEEKRDVVFVIENRKEGIKLACQLAKEKDVVVIAGKGHEKYQDINGIKHPFDDKKVLKTFLK